MKRFPTTIAAAALLVAAGLGTACRPAADLPEAEPARYILALSPFLEDAEKDSVFQRIAGFLLEDMALGSTLAIYDAYHLRTIARVEVPKVGAFRSGKTRAHQFKDPLQRVREFLATPRTNAVASSPELARAIRLPQFLDFAAENFTVPDQPMVVILLGSPLYVDDRESSFSMVDGYFPSDGHLLASKDQSIYGLKERAGALRDVAVHFGYFGDPWTSQIHRDKISRFWSLFIGEQGGRLATFCADLDTVFDAARTKGNASAGRSNAPQIDPEQTKIEMLRISRETGVTDWITRDLSEGPASPPPAGTVGPIRIGIRWQGAMDLDLYCRPKPRAETLYFEHTRSPEGYYFKDHRSSPEREYEFIEFERAVDVREAEALVNFYEGRAPGGVQGEVRLEFEGRIYSSGFSIPADRGNLGRAGNGQGPFWTRLDLPAILGLTR